MTAPFLVLDFYTGDSLGVENTCALLAPQAVELLRATRDEMPAKATDFAGIVLSGSTASVAAAPAWLEPAGEFLRTAIERDVPVLGLCFGHQLLAEVACGRGTVVPASRPEVGWHEIAVGHAEQLLNGLGATCPAFLCHFDEVRPDTAGIQILARTPVSPVGALRVLGRRAFGVQFHPEMTVADARAAAASVELESGAQATGAGGPNGGDAGGREVGRVIFDNFVSLALTGE